MYRAASSLIDESVQRDGNIATKMPKVRGLRTIKKEILKLITTYVDRADDVEMIHQTLVPQLLEAILLDYHKNVPDARDAEVLAVITVLIAKLHVRWTPLVSKYMLVRTPLCYDPELPLITFYQGMMTEQVPAILDNVFSALST